MVFALLIHTISVLLFYYAIDGERPNVDLFMRQTRMISSVGSHVTGADPGFFLGGGALVSCSTSTPINLIYIYIFFFFCRIPVVLENRRSSPGRGGAHPLHPPPRSAPVLN